MSASAPPTWRAALRLGRWAYAATAATALLGFAFHLPAVPACVLASVIGLLTLTLEVHHATIAHRPVQALRWVGTQLYGTATAEVLPGLVIVDQRLELRVFVGSPWPSAPSAVAGIPLVPLVTPGFPDSPDGPAPQVATSRTLRSAAWGPREDGLSDPEGEILDALLEAFTHAVPGPVIPIAEPTPRRPASITPLVAPQAAPLTNPTGEESLQAIERALASDRPWALPRLSLEAWVQTMFAPFLTLQRDVNGARPARPLPPTTPALELEDAATTLMAHVPSRDRLGDPLRRGLGLPDIHAAEHAALHALEDCDQAASGGDAATRDTPSRPPAGRGPLRLMT